MTSKITLTISFYGIAIQESIGDDKFSGRYDEVLYGQKVSTQFMRVIFPDKYIHREVDDESDELFEKRDELFEKRDEFERWIANRAEIKIPGTPYALRLLESDAHTNLQIFVIYKRDTQHEFINRRNYSAQIKELSFEEQANFNLFLAEHNLPPAGYQTLQITYF